MKYIIDKNLVDKIADLLYKSCPVPMAVVQPILAELSKLEPMEKKKD